MMQLQNTVPCSPHISGISHSFSMDIWKRRKHQSFIPRSRVGRCALDAIPPWDEIVAKGKRVVIIGDGDTGADSAGTAI